MNIHLINRKIVFVIFVLLASYLKRLIFASIYATILQREKTKILVRNLKTEYCSRPDIGGCHTLAKSVPGYGARGAIAEKTRLGQTRPGAGTGPG